MVRPALFISVLIYSVPALANDSVAELGTGGILLAHSESVDMEREDLFLSTEEVRVDYVFRNTSGAPVRSLVAFPMPDISADPYEMDGLPDHAGDNFLDFSVQVEGKALAPTLDQRASAAGVDVTDELRRQGVPLFPLSEAARVAVKALSPDVKREWTERGLLIASTDDDGVTEVAFPYWTLRSAYWWNTEFPANHPLRVSHRYKPSVGTTAGLNFFSAGKFDYAYGDYKRRYCFDAAFEKAVRKAAAAAKDDLPAYFETRLRYVLSSGGNWATGRIGRFHLTVDKGAADNLISFCGKNVQKTGPTTFEMTETDFAPLEDIDILILKPYREEDYRGMPEGMK